MKNLSVALKSWTNLLGSKNVLTNPVVLSAAQFATFPTSQKILAIIKPESRQQVPNILKVANKFKIPIYPISSGKNWGYGSKVPIIDSVLVDLSRLNRILDYNEKFAYVTVEPGVTFRQLYEFLRDKKSNLIASVTGSSPEASLIGNALERGVGKGKYGQRSEFICGLEVILPTGDCIHTGFERFPNTKVAKLAREGVGPFVDGLFIQSNFGIVTKMTVWLFPRPAHSQIFFYSIKDKNKLSNLIENLRILKVEEVLTGNFLLANDYRLLSSRQQYPWKDTNGKTPLPLNILEKIKQNWQWGGAWNGEGIVYAPTRELLLSKRRRIEQVLSDCVDNLNFIDEKILNVPRWLRLPFYLITGHNLDVFKAAYRESIFYGIPTDLGIKSSYWRKKSTIPKNMDLDKDRCGVIWISPTVPFDGKDVVDAIAIVERILNKYGFEPNIGINCLTDRAVSITGEIIYDRSWMGEDRKAISCHNELLQSLIRKGFIPYRLNILSMDSLPRGADDYVKFMTTIKKTLDPYNILAPNRYNSF